MAGKYLTYPEYKDSEITWLGNIPVSWNVLAIKMLSEIYNGSTPKSGEKLFWDGEISWVTPADLGKTTSPYISVGLRSITIKGYESCGTSLVPKDSIILSSRAPIGTLGIALNDLSTNQGCKSLVVKKGFYPKFLYYVLLSSTQQLNLLGRGTTFLELSSDELGTYKISSPLGIEQEKIANFLDHETTKIDTLIKKQQQLIKLLKEKRQAVISHAVTKGLNPNAPMRDSGVEWLGNVPEHWKVATVRRYLLEHRQGYYTTEAYVDNGTKLLRITDLKDLGEISTYNCPKVPNSDSLSNYLLKEGDVVFARTGGAGSFGVIPKLTETVAYASYLIRFRFLPKYFNRDYLRFMLIADSFQLAVKRNIHGGVNQNIHAEDIKDTFVASPSLKEQLEISLYLDKQSFKYAELIEKAESAIGLMQERRTAIISATVTGKIDVRHLDRHSNNTDEAA